MSKFSDLREGKLVEWDLPKGGKTKARLNKDKGVLELATGEEWEIPDEFRSDLIPETEQQLRVAKEKESLEKSRQSLGSLGTSLYQFGQSGGLGGIVQDIGLYPESFMQAMKTEKGQENLSFLQRIGENYQTKRRARKELSEELQSEEPVSSLVGKGAELGAELFLTRGMSGTKALPLMTVAEKGIEGLKKPVETAKEAAVSAVIGKMGDKASKFLGDVAKRRLQRRTTSQLAKDVERANIEGAQRAESANAQRAYETNLRREMADYSNRLEKSRVEAANAFREGRIADYQKAIQNRENLLKQVPALQSKEQERFSAEVMKNVEKISQTLDKGQKIPSENFGVGKFIEDQLETSVFAGTKDAAEASKFLTTLFKEGRQMTAEGLERTLKSVEERIQRAAPGVRDILIDFKDYIGKQIPRVISEAKFSDRFGSKIQSDISRAIDKTIKEVVPKNDTRMISRVKDYFSDFQFQMNPDFFKSLENGTLDEHILLSIDKHFFDQVTPPKEIAKQLGIKPKTKALTTIHENERAVLTEFSKKLPENIQSALERYPAERSVIEETINKRLGLSPQKIKGTAPSVPVPPEIPPPVIPPKEYPQLQTIPQKYVPQPFVPSRVPEVPGAVTSAERLGDVLEKPIMSSGKGVAESPIAKIAALKYILGKAALPIEATALAGYGAAKAATAPTTMGQAIRQAIKTGGGNAVPNAINSYLRDNFESYSDGILEDPYERMRASSEIEQVPFLGIEEKAHFQTKINRGKPLR